MEDVNVSDELKAKIDAIRKMNLTDEQLAKIDEPQKKAAVFNSRGTFLLWLAVIIIGVGLMIYSSI